MSLQTQAPADPTADVSQQEAELTAYLIKRTSSGVPHAELMAALLTNFAALALAYPCCTESAARNALRIGGHLLIKSHERPANASVH